MGIFEAICGFFKSLAAVLGFAQHRSELNNAPEVQDMEQRRGEEKAVDEAQKAVKKKDTKKIQNLLG